MNDRYYYVAGPMSGIPQFNIPAFDEASKALREAGYNIISPAELDDPVTRKMAFESPDGATLEDKHPNGESWGDFLSRDVKIVADKANGIIVLPGWENSRGARLEMMVALLCGHDILYYNPSFEELAVPMDSALAAKLVVNEFFESKPLKTLMVG